MKISTHDSEYTEGFDTAILCAMCVQVYVCACILTSHSVGHGAKQGRGDKSPKAIVPPLTTTTSHDLTACPRNFPLASRSGTPACSVFFKMCFGVHTRALACACVCVCVVVFTSDPFAQLHVEEPRLTFCLWSGGKSEQQLEWD